MEKTIPIKRIQESRHLVIEADNNAIHEGHLVLINRNNPIRQPLPQEKLELLGSDPDIHLLDKDISLETTALQQLKSLLEACGGINDIIAVSGYRTKEKQEHIYQSSLLENGADYTARYVAWPDQSEHQTGLAIDVGRLNKDVDFIAPAFPDSGVYLIFKQLAAQYGFIQRYKEGKESITNISCEPWHFRYIGYPHAMIIGYHDFCLEEYIDFLQEYPLSHPITFEDSKQLIQIYYVPAENGPSTTIPIIKCDSHHLSGNNRDGFIVTAFTNKGE